MKGVTLLRGFSLIAAGSGPYYPRKVRDHCICKPKAMTVAASSEVIIVI